MEQYSLRIPLSRQGVRPLLVLTRRVQVVIAWWSGLAIGNNSLPFERQSVQFVNIVQIYGTAFRGDDLTTELINVPVMDNTDSYVGTWLRNVGWAFRCRSSCLPLTCQQIKAVDQIGRARDRESRPSLRRCCSSPKKHFVTDDCDRVTPSRWRTRR